VHAVRAKRLPAVLVVAESGHAGGVSRYCVDVAAELGPMAEIACLCPQACDETACWLSARCAGRGVRVHRVTVPARAWRSGVRGSAAADRVAERFALSGRRANPLDAYGLIDPLGDRP
jgi:hypothetical protein